MALIRKFLDLSTSHLPESLGKSGLSELDGVTTYEWEHGWLMWVPDDPDAHAAGYEEPLPDVVLNIQRYARARGCDYVLLDSDGHHCPDLPSWSW